ncbi:hypothetical protein VTK73DRAFT_9807 [Phialemonium thermophilum]|uniref:Uncharacterized protein n=1 Tax=Phialemonium thermophilum TaxID=223376 RepID=A0ABR3W093_9PEZI
MGEGEAAHVHRREDTHNAQPATIMPPAGSLGMTNGQMGYAIRSTGDRAIGQRRRSPSWFDCLSREPTHAFGSAMRASLTQLAGVPCLHEQVTAKEYPTVSHMRRERTGHMRRERTGQTGGGCTPAVGYSTRHLPTSEIRHPLRIRSSACRPQKTAQWTLCGLLLSVVSRGGSGGGGGGGGGGSTLPSFRAARFLLHPSDSLVSHRPLFLRSSPSVQLRDGPSPTSAGPAACPFGNA